MNADVLLKILGGIATAATSIIALVNLIVTAKGTTIENKLKPLRADINSLKLDETRIQLLLSMHDDPDNSDAILRVAQHYFVNLGGDWYMSAEFEKWAKAHRVNINWLDNSRKEKNL